MLYTKKLLMQEISNKSKKMRRQKRTDDLRSNRYAVVRWSIRSIPPMPLLHSFTTVGLTIHHRCLQAQWIKVEQTDYPSICRPSHFLNKNTRNHHSSFSYLQAFLVLFSVFANSSGSINVSFSIKMELLKKLSKYTVQKDPCKSLVSCSTTSSPKSNSVFCLLPK